MESKRIRLDLASPLYSSGKETLGLENDIPINIIWNQNRCASFIRAVLMECNSEGSWQLLTQAK
eukprot:scaffold134321_cov18-Prasinocladus_malaysianus.AAC.3